MEWTKGVPGGVHRHASTAARVKKERIVLDRDSGPRPEAGKEEKGKRTVANVTSEFCWSCGKTRNIAATSDNTISNPLERKIDFVC